MTVELYVISGSPYAWRVQLGLEVKRVPHITHVLSMSAGDLRTPEYLAKNPRGRVPTLVDGHTVICESLAILAYVDQRWREPSLFGRSAEQVGAIWQAISEFTSYLELPIEHFVAPVFSNTADTHREQIVAAIATIDEELARYDARLTRSAYLAGNDELTAADFVVFPHIQLFLRAVGKDAARAFELPMIPLATRFPALEAWRARIENLPYYAKTVPPHWRPVI